MDSMSFLKALCPEWKKRIIACWGEVEMQISKIRDSLSKQSLSQVKCPVDSRIQTLSDIWKCWILGASGSGVWKVTLDAQDAGGPYTINASSKVGNTTSSISLADVLLGDVWLCSGQSNMAFTVTQVQICTCKLLSMYGTHSTVCNNSWSSWHNQAPVVQKGDSANHWINLNPLDSAIYWFP